MQIKKIKVGEWYRTRQGVGRCLQVGGCFPVAVKLDIRYPFARGEVWVVPRDVTARVDMAATGPSADFSFGDDDAK